MALTTPLVVRLVSAGAAIAILAGCGAISSITDDEVGVTGTDEMALRAAADDSIAAFIARDATRAATYIDPACGVTAERAETVLLEAESLVLAFTGLTLEEAYGSIRVVSVSVNGSSGTVTQASDALPSLFESNVATDPAVPVTTAAPTEPELTETEWQVVNGRWVLPSCLEYLTFEEQGVRRGSARDPERDEPRWRLSRRSSSPSSR